MFNSFHNSHPWERAQEGNTSKLRELASGGFPSICAAQNPKNGASTSQPPLSTGHVLQICPPISDSILPLSGDIHPPAWFSPSAFVWYNDWGCPPWLLTSTKLMPHLYNVFYLHRMQHSNEMSGRKAFWAQWPSHRLDWWTLSHGSSHFNFNPHHCTLCKREQIFSHHHFIKEESKVKKVNDLLQITELGGSKPPCLQMQYQNANF